MPQSLERKPPPGRWLRVSEAAPRLGMAPGLLAASIAAGRLDLRFVHLGRRPLLHLAEHDVEALRAQLAKGEVAP